MSKAKKVSDLIPLQGFSRVQIVNEDGSLAGDSGWHGPNQVTNLGFQIYLCALLGNTTGSKQVGFMALGTGTAPGASDTTLEGEVNGTAATGRKAVAVSITSSKTTVFTATFASSDSFVTASANISNVGLFNATTSNDTLFAGNTYASSAVATNQQVNSSYEIRFS